MPLQRNSLNVRGQELCESNTELETTEPAELRSCGEVEVAVLGSQSLTDIVLMVSVDVKQQSSGGRPGLPVRMSLMVSVHVKQH